jgi:indole-3-acetate monooxygenase
VSPYHDGPLYKAIFMLMAHSGHALGIARAAIEAAVDTEAKGYGVLAQVMGRDGAKIALAQAEAILRSTRCYVWDALQRAYDEALAGEVAYETTASLQLAMVHSVHEAARVVDLVFHQCGSRSVFTSNRLSQCFRDIHTATQHIIIFEPNYRVIGEYLFTKDQPDGPKLGPGIWFAER